MMTRFRGRAALVLAGLLISLPLIVFGFPSHTDDGHFHLSWSVTFADQFWHGDLYPRWLASHNGGLGSPAFVFYPPVPYYITSLLRPCFGANASPGRVLGAMAALAILTSGITCYRWLRRAPRDRAAAIAAVAYMALPYHLIDIYERGAFAELWAFAWLPLVMRFARALRERPASRLENALGLSLAYALLVGTHLPSALMVAAVPLGYAAWLAAPGSRLRGAGVVAAAMALGVGLAAAYVVPALLEQGHVSMADMRTGLFDYRSAFFFSTASWGTFPHWESGRSHVETGAFWAAVASLGIAGSGYVVARYDGALKREAGFFLAVTLASFAMMLPMAAPVYRLFPPLQAIQFPWRFNVVTALAAVTLVAVGLRSLDPSRFQSSLVAVLGFGLFGMLAGASSIRLEAERLLKGEAGAQLQLRPSDTWDPSEYKPHWAKGDLKEMAAAFPSVRGGGSKPRYLDGEGDVRVISWRPRSIEMTVTTAEPATLEVGQLYLPEWAARLDDGSPAAVTASPARGLVLVAVPAGKHRVSLRLTRSRSEKVGAVVSAASAALGLGLAVGSLVRRRRQTLRG